MLERLVSYHRHFNLTQLSQNLPLTDGHPLAMPRILESTQHRKGGKASGNVCAHATLSPVKQRKQGRCHLFFNLQSFLFCDMQEGIQCLYLGGRAIWRTLLCHTLPSFVRSLRTIWTAMFWVVFCLSLRTNMIQVGYGTQFKYSNLKTNGTLYIENLRIKAEMAPNTKKSPKITRK